MFLFSNGCSHTAKFFNNGYMTKLSKCLIDLDFPNNHLKYVTQYLFGGHPGDGGSYLDNPFNMIKSNENLNLSFAYPGKSNDSIFYETYESLLHLKRIQKLPDYVIIQWSGPNRRMHSLPDEEWMDIGPHRELDLQIKFEPMASMQTLHYMLIIQNLLKELNIEYVFISYMELDNHIEKIESFKDLNLDRFISLKGFHPIFDGFRNQFRELGWATDWHGHPDARAHYKLTELILEKINKKDKLLPFDTLYNLNDALILEGSYDFSHIKKAGIMHLLKDGGHEVLDEYKIPWKPEHEKTELI